MLGMHQEPKEAPETVTPLLTVETVGPYLSRRGLVTAGSPVEVEALGGGISNVVLAVQAGDRACVVKQSLPRLRVAEEWLAKRERVLTEAAALLWAHDVTPSAVPAVLDVDEAMWTITIECAPASWQNWKTCLLSGAADPKVATRLGTILASWHSASREGASGANRFDDGEVFDQLRVDPYYRTVMIRHPDLAPEIDSYVARLQSTRSCLVHGDFSPKNVLLGEEGLWVVDFEVAHLGDPAFDLAFMLNHLMLKAIHRPNSAGEYRLCAEAFWRAYCRAVSTALAPRAAYVFGHVACQMLARVDGKSPAEYLTAGEQAHARALARSMLSALPSAPAEAWRMLGEEVVR